MATKIQIIENIDDIITEIEELFPEDENESSRRYGIDNKYCIGEFAFPYFEDQFGYDLFTDDNIESCKAECGYDGEIQYLERSSKSGTEVYIDPFVSKDGDLDDTLYLSHGYEKGYTDDEYLTHKECLEVLSEVKLILKSTTASRKLFDEQVIKVTEIIRSVALGERSGSFSNGEVIFTPTETYEGATSTFTPYYNPNEEVA